MKSLSYLIFIAFFAISCSSNESNNASSNENEERQIQSNLKTLEVNFPAEPETISDVLPIRGHEVNVAIHLAKADSGVYSLYELELGALHKQVAQDERGFFNGILSYLINDMGAQVGPISEFDDGGIKGLNFSIISPKKNEQRTAKGKTLLVAERAYIWFGISNAANSTKNVNQFVDSYKLKQ